MTSGSSQRPRISHVIVIVWLMLSSALTAVNHVALFRQKEDVDRQLKTSVDSTQLSIYEDKLAELQQQLNAISLAPTPLTETRFAAERQALVDQLSSIERTLANFASATELQAVRDQVRAVEGRLPKLRRAEAIPTVTPKAPAQPTEPHGPPFAVLAVEARGGERFLSVMPLGSRSLADVRLLRLGEVLEGWQLAALDADAALFQIGDRQHRVALP